MEKPASLKKPLNVLWLMTDQHHAFAMGCAGHPDVKTPHLDKLAASGVRFERAYCNNPVCAPSRSTFLTGQHPHTHGVLGNDVFNYTDTLPPNIGSHFRENGYEAAMVGKGHLPKSWMEAGFETLRYCDLADAERHDPRTCHYFDYLVQQGIADDYDHGKLYPPHPGSMMRAFESKIPQEHSLEVWTGNEALRFLENRDADRPFFLKVSFQRPHDPHAVSPEKMGMYDPEALTLPENARDYLVTKFKGKPKYQEDYVKEGNEGYPYRAHDEADLRRQLSFYLTLVTIIDEQIGRILSYLEETGQWENTVIAYNADHGDFAGEHGLMLKNMGIFEAIHRIPFLVRWPQGPKTVCHELVESVDFVPTMCAAAGIPELTTAEGRDLRLVADGEESGLDHTVCEWDFPKEQQRTVFAVRTQTHRLVFYLNQPDDGELYNMIDDPGEMENFWDSSEHLALRERLLRNILCHVGSFHRNYTFKQDRDQPKENPVKQIHVGGKSWLEISSSI